MEKAIIETWVGAFSVTQLNLNKEGIRRFREALDKVEQEKNAVVADDYETSIELSLCEQPQEIPKKGKKRTYFGLILTYLSMILLVGFAILGAFYLKELLG
ncbi:hypothetical protein VDG1235_1925 [Verrucomicrobiia bacterium DG1235]|nr:hypothetical protein VDG1235_1925 [Verrucomicrobiae bacterium DG1235]